MSLTAARLQLALAIPLARTRNAGGLGQTSLGLGNGAGGPQKMLLAVDGAAGHARCPGWPRLNDKALVERELAAGLAGVAAAGSALTHEMSAAAG